MTALFRNDAQGVYPPSYYAATADIPPPRAPLDGDARFDVAIIGAGFCGLWAALTCARGGLSVAVIEAHRVGFGASGRNGGQVGSGYNKSQRWLAARMGDDAARALWNIAEEGKDQLRRFCAEHAPEAQFKPGVARGGWTVADAAAYRNEATHLHATYGYTDITPLDGPVFRAIVRSDRYQGGTLDIGAGHVHPLNYALALGRAAEAASVTILEGTVAKKVTPGSPVTVQTDKGRITAGHAILAGNGYMPDLAKSVAARTMPINSFIAATEPLGDRAEDVLARDIAVADDRFVVNYFRLSDDRRLLFGGRENYSLGFPRDIGTRLCERMEQLFPQLKGVPVTHVWGGTLGITISRLPHVTRFGPNALSAGGFSGHGVALSGMAGRVMGEAVLGQAGRFDVMAELPCPKFPGGSTFRAPLLTLAMSWYALRDKLGV